MIMPPKLDDTEWPHSQNILKMSFPKSLANHREALEPSRLTPYEHSYLSCIPYGNACTMSKTNDPTQIGNLVLVHNKHN